MSQISTTDENFDGRYSEFARVLQRKRKDLNLSLGELARLADISKSNLSRLESGNGNPSLETMWALSKALNISVRELIDPNAGGVRFESGDHHSSALSETAEFSAALLSSCPIGATRDIYWVKLEPGQAKLSAPHGAGIIEHIILFEGRARIGPSKNPSLMARGDYLTFSGNQDHVYEALVQGTVAIVVMEIS